MSLATLNGAPVLTCRVSIPAFGLWWAEVECGGPDVLTGPVALVLDDLTLRGTVVTGGAYQTRTRYRIVGGAGGWGRSIAAKSYANDLGVKSAIILRDAALACGETMGVVPPTDAAGPAFVRAAGPASRTLEALYPRGWYVDEKGITQVGRRLPVPFTGSAQRMVNDAAMSSIELAPDAGNASKLLPGAIVDDVEAADVEHVVDGGTHRATVWGWRSARTGDPFVSALANVIDQRLAAARFFALWEYRIVQQSGIFLDLQIVRVSSGMPDLRHVPSCPAATYMDNLTPLTPQLGSTCLVAFVNGDPSRPQLVARSGDPVLVGATAINAAGIVMGGSGSPPTKALVGRIGVGG
jgi:hypothetical protein